MEPITPSGAPDQPPQASQPTQPVAPASVPPATVVSPVVAAPVVTPATSPAVFQPEPTPTKLGSQDAVPIGVSASSLGLNGKLSTPLPIGIYIIAGLTLLNFLAVFFNTNTNPLYSIVMVFDLLVAIGLFSKLEIARKAAFYVQVLSIISVCIVIGLLINLQLKTDKDYTLFNQAIGRIQTADETPEQKTEIAALEAKVQQARNQLGHVVIVAYVRDGISLAVSAGIAFYLMRPGVKEAFHAQEA